MKQQQSSKGTLLQSQDNVPEALPKLEEYPLLPSLMELQAIPKDNLEARREHLAAILVEAAKLTKPDGDLHRWPLNILCLQIHDQDGSKISLLKIFKEYSYCCMRIEEPKLADRVSQNESINIPSYSAPTLLRKLINQHIGVDVPRGGSGNMTIALDLPPACKVLNELSSENIEQMLKRILEEVFQGDILEFSASRIESDVKITIDGRELSGKKLLSAYSKTEYARRNPGVDVPKSSGLEKSGFSPKDLITAFRQRELLLYARGHPYPVVECLLIPELEHTPLALAAVEKGLRYIFQKRCGGNSDMFTLDHMMLVHIRTPSGRDIGFKELLSRYAASISPDLSLRAALEKYRRDVLLIGRFPGKFSDFTTEDISDFIHLQRLDPVIQALGNNPTNLIQGLQVLNLEAFESRDIGEFVRRYVGLHVEQFRGGEGGTYVPTNVWQNSFVAAILEAARLGHRLNLGEHNFADASALFIQTSRLAFQKGKEQFLDYLKERQAAYEATTSNEHLTPEASSFIARLYKEAEAHFRRALAFNVEEHMRRAPFPYQREGALFLYGIDRGMLCDEAGMGKTYQAVAAALMRGFKRVVWVTTASTKGSVREEILEDTYLSPEEVQIISSDTPEARSRQLDQATNARVVIINYETLVAIHRDSSGQYAKLRHGVDCVVLDEGQLVDNLSTLRYTAVADLETPVLWILSATPYQNRLERFFTSLNLLDPKRFPDQRVFNELYTRDTDGVRLLNTDLRDVLLRRTKDQTVPYIDIDPEKPLEEQFAENAALLPRLRNYTPEEAGSYTLSQEQEDTIVWMLTDFEGWATWYNENISKPGREIELESINPLSKFQWIHAAIYSPDKVGIATRNPLYDALDMEVERRIKAGEKLILWAWNTDIIKYLHERYARFGAVRFDGETSEDERDKARRAFQNDPSVCVFVGNMRSGGFGLTLTGAHNAILVQFPLAFPFLYQIEARHHRVLTAQQIALAKREVGTLWMTPRFSSALKERMQGTSLEPVINSGTLVEQTFSRLEGGRYLYNLAMNGYGDPKEVDQYFQQKIFRGMGLLNNGGVKLFNNANESTRELYSVATAFLPIADKLAGNTVAQDLLLQVIEASRGRTDIFLTLAQNMVELPEVGERELRFVLSLAQVENDYLSKRLLAVPPKVFDCLARGKFTEGQTIAVNKLDLEATLPLFLEALTDKERVGEIVSPALLRHLGSERDTPKTRDRIEHLIVGLFKIIDSPVAQRFCSRCVDDLQNLDVNDQVRFYFKLGAALGIDQKLVEVELEKNADVQTRNASDAILQITNIAHSALARFCDVTLENIQTTITGPEWGGNCDQILALVCAWREYSDDEFLSRAKSAFKAVFEGRYHTWRYETGERDAGATVNEDAWDDVFWKEFARNCSLNSESVIVSSSSLLPKLGTAMERLEREVHNQRGYIEGKIAQHVIKKFRSLAPELRAPLIAELEYEVSLLGRTLGAMNADINYEINPEVVAICRRRGVKVSTDAPLIRKSQLHALRSELERGLDWCRFEDLVPEAQKPGGELARAALRGILSKKESWYKKSGAGHLVSCFETPITLLRAIQSLPSSGNITQKVRIVETDHPAYITAMGALRPEMRNCFNPIGNPLFNETVLSALGSRNFKLVLVFDEEERIVACMHEKVRRGPDGKPVLFLERGLSVSEYAYRNEALDLLKAKARSIGEQCYFSGSSASSGKSSAPHVATQVVGKINPNDILLYGTGSYTGAEYAEAVFTLRDATKVIHKGRIVQLAEAPTEMVPVAVAKGFVGVAMSNRHFAEYLSELKSRGVALVVDVRATPLSRYVPHYNREALAASLKANGIDYIWMGDKLGNPKDFYGKRTLEAFDAMRKSGRYLTALEELKNLKEKAAGAIAITCVEKNEEQCHRKFILADLLQLQSGSPIIS